MEENKTQEKEQDTLTGLFKGFNDFYNDKLKNYKNGVQ